MQKLNRGRMPVGLKAVRWVIVVAGILLAGQAMLRAGESSGKEAEAFRNILEGAYRVSCGEFESLRDYYVEEAEIINNGLQMTLDETVDELRGSLSSVMGLSCSYSPKIRVHHVSGDLAYAVVRESIRLTASEIGERQIEQLCTYIFSRSKKGWKIAHDHCSSVPGLSV